MINSQNNYNNQSTFRVEINGQRTSILIFDLRVVCKKGYFGPDCGCTPQDDSTGHFTCDENGTIVCLPGYQNTTTNCVEEVITPEPTTDLETISDTSTMEQVTVDDICPENSGDIVPIVVGVVAGGLAVLLLILSIIINIVLVVHVLKLKTVQQQLTCNQGTCMDTCTSIAMILRLTLFIKIYFIYSGQEHIAMEANPVYDIKKN